MKETYLSTSLVDELPILATCSDPAKSFAHGHDFSRRIPDGNHSVISDVTRQARNRIGSFRPRRKSADQHNRKEGFHPSLPLLIPSSRADNITFSSHAINMLAQNFRDH